MIDFNSFKRIFKKLGETLNDDEIMETMHNNFIIGNTETNESFSFDEFNSIATKERN